jgi:ankyrin repeat protein
LQEYEKVRNEVNQKISELSILQKNPSNCQKIVSEIKFEMPIIVRKVEINTKESDSDNNYKIKINGGCGLRLKDIQTHESEVSKLLWNNIQSNVSEMDSEAFHLFKYNSENFFVFRLYTIDYFVEQNEEYGKLVDFCYNKSTLSKQEETLFQSIILNDQKQFDEILAKSININVINNDGKTPINVATHFNRVDLIKKLMRKNANIFLKDFQGNNVLHIATMYNYPELVDLFGQKLKNTLTRDNSNSLYLAASRGNTNILKKLITLGENINIKNNSGLFPLHSAIFNCFPETASILLDCTNIEDITLANGRTSMHLVCEMGYSDLLKKMFSINNSSRGSIFSFKQGDDGLSPLHIAVINNHEKIVEIILENININLINLQASSGIAAIHLVKDLRILGLLLLKGANPNLKNNEGFDALMVAISTCKVEIALKLIECTNLDNLCNTGWSAFQLACQYGFFDISEAILRKKVVSYLGLDPSGNNYIHYLIKYGSTKLFLKYSNQNKNSLKIPTNDGLSILDLCFIHNNEEIISVLRFNGFIKNLNFENLISMEFRYITYAIINNMKSLVDEYLVTNGKLDLSHYKILLSTACKHGRYEIFKSILDFTDNIDNNDILEFVYNSIFSYDFDLIKFFLIKYEINHLSLIHEDMTLPELACAHNNVILLKQLSECGVKLDEANPKTGLFPVYQSVKFFHRDTFSYFIDSLNNFFIPEDLVFVITKYGRIEFFKDLLKNDNDNNQLKNSKIIIDLLKESMLHSQYEMFKFLLYLPQEFDYECETLIKISTELCLFEYTNLILEKFGKTDLLQSKLLPSHNLNFHDLLSKINNLNFITSRLNKNDFYAFVPQKLISDDKITLLQLAIILDNIPFVEFCLSKNILFKQNSLKGNSLLHILAFSNNSDMFSLIVSKITDHLLVESDLNKLNSDGLSALHIAVAKCSLNFIKSLVSLGVDPNCEGLESITPLMLAIEAKRGDVIDYLISLPCVKNYKNKQNITPIYYSVLKCDTITIVKLLSLNVEINSLYGEKMETILHAAIFTKSIDIIILFFKKIFLNTPDKDGAYPIHKVYSLGEESILNFFKYHTSNEFVCDSEGKLPLHYSLLSEKKEFIKNVVNINCKSRSDLVVNYNRINKGKGSFFESAIKGNADIIKYLIDYGLDLNQKDGNGNDILIHAVRSGNKILVEYLVSCKNLNLEIDKGLIFSAIHGQNKIAKYFLNDLKLSPDTNLANSGESALSMAAISGSDKVLILLLKHGAKANYNAAFLNAINNGNTTCLKILLSWGLDITYKDNLGNNYLHAAIKTNRGSVVVLLLLRGIDPAEKNYVNHTSYDIAISNNNLDILTFLALTAPLKFSVEPKCKKINEFIEKYIKIHSKFNEKFNENGLHLLVRLNLTKPIFIKFAVLQNNLHHKNSNNLNPFQLAISLVYIEVIKNMFKFYENLIDLDTIVMSFQIKDECLIDKMIEKYFMNIISSKSEIIRFIKYANTNPMLNTVWKKNRSIFENAILEEEKQIIKKIENLKLDSFYTVEIIDLLDSNSILKTFLNDSNVLQEILSNIPINTVASYYLLWYSIKINDFKPKEIEEKFHLGDEKVLTFLLIQFLTRHIMLEDFILNLSKQYNTSKQVLDLVFQTCFDILKSSKCSVFLKKLYDLLKDHLIFKRMDSNIYEKIFILCNSLPLLRTDKSYSKQTKLQKLALNLHQGCLDKHLILNYIASNFSEHNKGFLGIIWGSKDNMTRSQLYAYVIIFYFYRKKYTNDLKNLEDFLNSLGGSKNFNFDRGSISKYFKEISEGSNETIKSSGGQKYNLEEIRSYLEVK